MRILIVEDEVKAAEYLKKGLGEAGFRVEVARNGIDGAHLIDTETFDLVLLDVMLPDRSGWDLIVRLRELRETPVIFLTARDSVADRVRGLELGADDYLVKPFSFTELLARVRSVLRRGQGRTSDRFVIHDLEIDPIARRVRRAGKRVDLSPKEFALLLLLARRQGEVLSRTVISEQVWDINFDSDTNVVDVAIKRLRAKIDDPFPKRLIWTVRGAGYVLDPDRDE